MATKLRRIIRIPETMRVTGMSRPTIYRREGEGRFPKKVKIGVGRSGSIGFFEDEVADWQEAMAEGREWQQPDRESAE